MQVLTIILLDLIVEVKQAELNLFFCRQTKTKLFYQIDQTINIIR